jgi:hypothetical protein
MHMTSPPQTDHPLTCGGLPSGTGDALTLGICSHGRLVIIILGGELDIATAPGLARRLEPLPETGSQLILDLAGGAVLRLCRAEPVPAVAETGRRRRRLAAPGGTSPGGPSAHHSDPAARPPADRDRPDRSDHLAWLGRHLHATATAS